MDIYHSTYTQYINLMTQLKDDVTRLANQSDSASTETGIKTVLTLIDNTIDTASGETFLPTGELLDITKELMNYKNNMCVKKTCSKDNAQTMFPYTLQSIRRTTTDYRRLRPCRGERAVHTRNVLKNHSLYLSSRQESHIKITDRIRSFM